MREKLVELKIDGIKVGKRHRPIDDKDDEAMLSLAEGIKTDGLIQPITVYKDNQLVTGARRLFAHVINEAATILAIWKPYNDTQAERAEIRENIERKQLTVLQEAQQTLRLKELYVAEHQGTRPVTERGGPGRGKKTSEIISSVLPFAETEARATGKTSRTVQMTIKLATDLDPEVQEDLKGTPIEDKKAELTRLAKRSVKDQRKIAKKLKTGEITRVPSKPKPATPKPKKPPKIEPTTAEFNSYIELFIVQHTKYVKNFLKALSQHPGGKIHPSPRKSVVGHIGIFAALISNLKNREKE